MRGTPTIATIASATEITGQRPGQTIIAPTPSAPAPTVQKTDGAISIREVDALVERMRLFERIGVNHLRIGPSAPDRKGHLEIVKQLAENVLPALR